MPLRTLLSSIGLGLSTLALSLTAYAAPTPRLPLSFDPNITADPSGTQAAIASEEATLPLLPTSTLTTVTVGPTTLWMWPGAATLLQSVATPTSGFLAWPDASSQCAHHEAFVMPAIVSGAPTYCGDRLNAIADALGARTACRHVAEPESYVLTYEPGKVDLQVTGSIEGLIGVAGEALSHHPLPNGILPAEFTATFRRIVTKLRSTSLGKELTDARAAYAKARALANASAGCFATSDLAKLGSDLAALQGEIDAQVAAIAKLESEGRAASAHDALCQTAHRRLNAALPYPTLSRAEREFTAFWLGGLYWRMRGGGILPLGSTQSARLYFLQQPFTRIGELAGGAVDGADAANQIYLAVFEGWSDWQDMGNTPNGGDKYADLVGMTGRGHRQVKGAVDLLAPRGYATAPLLTGGLQMGPCYFLSEATLNSFVYAATTTPPYGDFIVGFTADAEFCSGASIALGLARTLLDGIPSAAPVAVDLCANRKCGDDTCGGSCGTCTDSLVCNAGKCEVADAPTDGGASPAELADGDAASANASEGGHASPATTKETGSRQEACACSLVGRTSARPAPGFLAGLALSALLAAIGRRRRL